MESFVNDDMDSDTDDTLVESFEPDRKRRRSFIPSTDFDIEGTDFINVVVRLTNLANRTLTFLRIPISIKMLDEMLDKIRHDPTIYYVRHHHGCGLGRDACSLDPNVNGPFTTNILRHTVIGAAVGSLVYCFLRNEPMYLVCDFSQRLPKWEEAKSLVLSSFRISLFETMTLDGKLYVFGSNGSSKKKSGKIFDPAKGCWEDLMLPITIDDTVWTRLLLASSCQKMLLLYLEDQLQYEYDPQLLIWNPIDHKGLLGHIASNVGNPISVEEETTFYWLDCHGNIRAFDWQRSKKYVGSIIGLTHVPMMANDNGPIAKLLHLKKELFCIIWVEVDPEDERNRVHLTVLRVSRDPSSESESSSDSVHRLFVAVMDCFHYRLDSMILIDDVYKW